MDVNGHGWGSRECNSHEALVFLLTAVKTLHYVQHFCFLLANHKLFHVLIRFAHVLPSGWNALPIAQEARPTGVKIFGTDLTQLLAACTLVAFCLSCLFSVISQQLTPGVSSLWRWFLFSLLSPGTLGSGQLSPLLCLYLHTTHNRLRSSLHPPDSWTLSRL